MLRVRFRLLSCACHEEGRPRKDLYLARHAADMRPSWVEGKERMKETRKKLTKGMNVKKKIWSKAGLVGGRKEMRDD